jgi:hypothetical protein
MKKVIKVITADGQTVKVMLDNWGGGAAPLHRRWTLQPEGWYCVDNGQLAQGLYSLAFHPMKVWDARHH